MLIDNSYYGHAAVLADSCGLSSSPPIWGYLQHGVTLGAPFNGYSMLERLPKLVWGEPAAQLCRQQGRRRVAPIGAPALYLLDALQRNGVARRAAATGTIVYPFHGWERGAAIGSHPDFATEIAQREVGPVTVCLHWNEAQDESVVEAYASQGFRVVCNGSRNFVGFLRAQVDELTRHRRFVTNRVGTGLFYASILRLEVDLYGEAFSIGAASESTTSLPAILKRWPELESLAEHQAEFRLRARTELGADLLLEPSELRALLGWNLPRRLAGPVVRSLVLARRRIKGLRRPEDPVVSARVLAHRAHNST